MNRDSYINEFIDLIDDQYKEFALKQIRMGLIQMNTIKNYLIVLELKKIQFESGKTYTEAISILAEKYNLSTRRIRFIYTKYRLFDKITSNAN